MAQDVPGQSPEGRLIEEAAKATGRSIRALAANAEMSDTRWRQVIRGHQVGPAGRIIEARASSTALARMAMAVGVTPEQLEEVDRPDAADEQRHLLDEVRRGATVTPGPAEPGASEIELINASTTMTTREKLQAIQIVLRLRAQLEAEERGQHEEASAARAEAEMNGTN
jgi:hypothetical protein